MKTTRTPYSYVVLRYMHDVFTREFVNVGVLLHAPRAGFLGFERLPSLDRVKSMFPGLQSDYLRDLLGFFGARAGEYNRDASEMLDRDLVSADTIAKGLLPTDDSSLQWSAPGGGVTDDPQQTLKELFERLVARHLKAHPATRRDDADIWKPFEREFRKRDVLSRLQEKVLVVGELRHRFENAWQPDGKRVRLYQPLSFDLLEPSDIVEKAVRWGALIHHLRKGQAEFYIYLLVGGPTDSRRRRAFDQALETLSAEDGQKEVVQEEDAPRFAADVEQEIKFGA